MSSGRPLSSGGVLAIILSGSTVFLVSLAVFFSRRRSSNSGRASSGGGLRRNDGLVEGGPPRTTLRCCGLSRLLLGSLPRRQRQNKIGAVDSDTESGTEGRAAWPAHNVRPKSRHGRPGPSPPPMSDAAHRDPRGNYYQAPYPYQQGLPWISLAAPQAHWYPPRPPGNPYHPLARPAIARPTATSPPPIQEEHEHEQEQEQEQEQGERELEGKGEGEGEMEGEREGEMAVYLLRAPPATKRRTRSTDKELDNILESTARRLKTGPSCDEARAVVRSKSDP